MAPIDLTVNGRTHRLEVDGDRALLGVLREELGLYGTKYGCGESRCGACTVWIGGRATRSCVTRVGDAADQPVTTIEGLARGSTLHPLQRAFLEHDAIQCGYCTPGMIMAGAALLARSPRPDEAEIVAAMNGNVCRCGVYPRIVAAIRQAGETMTDADG